MLDEHSIFYNNGQSWLLNRIVPRQTTRCRIGQHNHRLTWPTVMLYGQWCVMDEWAVMSVTEITHPYLRRFIAAQSTGAYAGNQAGETRTHTILQTQKATLNPLGLMYHSRAYLLLYQNSSCRWHGIHTPSHQHLQTPLNSQTSAISNIQI